MTPSPDLIRELRESRPTAPPELRLDAIHRIAHGGVPRRIDRLAYRDVEQHLRELVHASREIAQRAARALHDAQHLQGRDQAVAGRGSIETEDVT